MSKRVDTTQTDREKLLYRVAQIKRRHFTFERYWTALF